MADYTWDIGNGVMMIRDTGTDVEFWFKANVGTFNHDQNFKYVTGAGTVTGEIDVPSDGSYVKAGEQLITKSQTVSFTIYDEGLGWPTSTKSLAVSRATAPDPPKALILEVLSNTSIKLLWGGDGDNNGDAIDDRRIYGSPTTTPDNGRDWPGGSYTWTGLTPGKTYYFWARTHNSEGWSSYSTRSTATTDDVPDAPDAPVISLVDQVSFKAVFTDNSNNGATVLERQLGYGLSSTAPTLFVSSNNTTISALSAGKTYYVWSRVRNTYGWSAWSARVTVVLVAGARVHDGGVYKRAVPYVKVAGIWKMARPWVKAAGAWKANST